MASQKMAHFWSSGKAKSVSFSGEQYTLGWYVQRERKSTTRGSIILRTPSPKMSILWVLRKTVPQRLSQWSGQSGSICSLNQRALRQLQRILHRSSQLKYLEWGLPLRMACLRCLTSSATESEECSKMRWRRWEVEQKCSSFSSRICTSLLTSWLPSMFDRYSLKQRSLATSSSLLAAAYVFIRYFSPFARLVRRERLPEQWSMANSASCELCCDDPIIQIIQIRYKLNMIKHKCSVSPLCPPKKLRPQSSGGACLTRKPASSNIINTIICSLQKNVKDLKTYYHARDNLSALSRPDKSQKAFRVKRTLIRNSSQSNLNPKMDKSDQDIFEIRNQYQRVHGRTTNNIVQLYEFYRKNQEKREKSTRILASMQLSNGGQSVSGGKESLLKHSQLFNHRENSRRQPEEQMIEEASEDSHQVQAVPVAKSPIRLKKAEKTSGLASDLISKGCYSIQSIADMLNKKRFRYPNEKEPSFKRPSCKQKLAAVEAKLQVNNQNNINADNIKTQNNEAKRSTNKAEYMEHPRSPQIIRNKPEISFKKVNEDVVASSGKSFECSSISKQEKDIEKRVLEDSSAKKEQLREKRGNKALLDLQQSPILAKNGKQFQKSKYYVMPIPQKASLLEEGRSLSLGNASKIVDNDSIYDL